MLDRRVLYPVPYRIGFILKAMAELPVLYINISLSLLGSVTCILSPVLLHVVHLKFCRARDGEYPSL